MSPLSDARRASLLAYCKLTELADDPEVAALLETFYGAAAAYMAQAGVSEPEEGTGPSTTCASTTWSWTAGTSGRSPFPGRRGTTRPSGGCSIS